MTETIIARLTGQSENYAKYNAAEPENPNDDFKRAIEGLYVALDAFDGEPAEFVEVRLGDDEALTLNSKKSTNHTRAFESEHSLNGRALVCSLYVAHRLYDEEVPEELSMTLDVSATGEDFEESVAAVEEEWSVPDEEEEKIEAEVTGFVQGESDDSDEDEEAADEEEEPELSEAEEELQAVVQSADE